MTGSVALASHAWRVPAAEPERCAERLHRQLAEPAFILETCYRVDAFAVMDRDARRLAHDVSLPTDGQTLAGEDAVRHPISVAVGRDSVVVGEDQILHLPRDTFAL